MNVRDCMTRDVHLAEPDQSIRDAAREMAKHDAGILPVGHNDRLIGMITDRDIAIRGVASGKGPEAKVRDIMTEEIKYCFDDERVEEVLKNMAEQRLRRMPVVDRNKRLVGIISLSDLARRGPASHSGEALGAIAKRGGPHSQRLH